MVSTTSTALLCCLVGVLFVCFQVAAAVPHSSYSPLKSHVIWPEKRSIVGSKWKIRGGGGAPHPNDADELTDQLNDILDEETTNNTAPKSNIFSMFRQGLPSLPFWSKPTPSAASEVQQNTTASSPWQNGLHQIRSTKVPSFRRTVGRVHVLESIQHHPTQIATALGPIAVAVLSQVLLRPKGLALPTVYALALLGSSAGFHLFLYFITVGFAMGITIPLTVALIVYNRQAATLLPLATNLHTGLVILWGIRFAAFLLWREYINWPQLHVKVMEVNQMATIPAKLLCWLVYSCFYVALLTPCWSRLANGDVQGAATINNHMWNSLGYAGIVLQVLGLTLESVADYQKSHYKAQEGQRNDWCHVGLWTFSTHPNYLGKALFWIGTYLGGFSSLYQQSSTKWKLIVATVGLAFIMTVLRAAVLSLDDKQMRKYGYNLDFVEFRRTHNLIGPAKWNLRQPRVKEIEQQLVINGAV